MVRVVDGQEVANLYSLIHPAKMYFIPEGTEEIHHISCDDVRNKPPFPEIWNTLVAPFLAEAPGLPLVANNAPFDMNVIRGCMDYFGMPVPELHYFDSRRVAQRTWPMMRWTMPAHVAKLSTWLPRLRKWLPLINCLMSAALGCYNYDVIIVWK